jgi:hypothetical protein
MYRHLFKFVVTSLTILSANLLTAFLSDKLISHKWEYRPLRFTLASMAIITIVFYPLFSKMEEWLNGFTRKFVKAGHSFAGKYVGLIFMYLIGLFILLYFYADLWYNLNIFQLIIKGKFLNLF